MLRRGGSPALVIGLAILATVCLSNLATAGFQQDYDKAVTSFRSCKAPADYRKAAEEFGSLIARKDAGALLGNCLYWQAECWYGLKEYEKALNAFEKALLVPNSNKEEACRYKVAACYSRLGLNDSARWELTRFLRDFPNGSLTGSAKKELDKLPAGGR